MVERLVVLIKKLVKKHSVLAQTYRALYGLYIYMKLVKRHGDDKHFIVIKGATGDVYIQFLLLKEYIAKKSISDYIIIGDGAGLIPISRLFAASNVEFMPAKLLDYLELAYHVTDGASFNLIIPFFWTSPVFYDNWKCRTRFKPGFSFLDTYVYMSYKMCYPLILAEPKFIEDKETICFWCQQHGVIRNKTIIISPEANSVTSLPIWFWNIIINEFKQAGYVVFMNCGGTTLYRAPNIFPLYEMAVPLLEYAGYFIGIRSGFCDIISSASCRKIILYPQVAENIDYGHHRSEMEFSCFGLMGYPTNNLLEISTPLLKNITQKQFEIDSFEDYYDELDRLKRNIVEGIMKY